MFSVQILVLKALLCILMFHGIFGFLNIFSTFSNYSLSTELVQTVSSHNRLIWKKNHIFRSFWEFEKSDVIQEVFLDEKVFLVLVVVRYKPGLRIYVYCQVDVHPLLRLPTSVHRALPSPAQPATSHFHRSLRRKTRPPALVGPMIICVPRCELLQCCDSKRSPIRLALRGWWSCCEPGGSSHVQLGLAWPRGRAGTEQDMSGGYLSFMTEHFGGRKARKRPALLMLQGSMVSMATPPAFLSQGWMPQGERWHSNHILGGWEGVAVATAHQPPWRGRQESVVIGGGQGWSHVSTRPPRAPNLGPEAWPPSGLAIQWSNSQEHFIREKRTLLKSLNNRKDLELPVSLFVHLLGIGEIISCWNPKTDCVGNSGAGDVTC